jgi:hypothetical protein
VTGNQRDRQREARGAGAHDGQAEARQAVDPRSRAADAAAQRVTDPGSRAGGLAAKRGISAVPRDAWLRAG